MKKVIAIAVVLMIFGSIFGDAHATIPSEERNALIDLYNSTDGANWTDKTNWLGAEGTECTWYGVICDAEKKNVMKIELHDNHLVGSIPNSIDNFHYLSILSMSQNKLSGTIPPQLGNLSNLELLYLWGNQLTGDIPSELDNLLNLKKLGLSYNSFSENTIPVWLKNLSNLESLYLQSCSLTGFIPAWMSNFSKLEILSLGGNQLTGSIPTELGNLSNLTELSLYGNQLTGSIPPELGNLSNLTELALYGNQLTGSITRELGNLSNLRRLRLHSNQLTGDIPLEMGNFSKLEMLSLGGNQLTGPIPTELGNLINLAELQIWGNQLTGSIPDELGNLSNLRRLRLDRNQLTGDIPLNMGNLLKLEILSLGDNRLTGPIPTELGNLINLRELQISENQLTGSIPSSLGNLSKLETLALLDNQLTGTIPEWIGNLQNLRLLNLEGNQLTSSIPPTLGNLSTLEYLILEGNQLTGTISEWIENLQNIKSLSLGGNKLTGTIPPGLGNLSTLESLNLGGNQLTSIPPALGNLSNLESLNLGGNKLTSIPPTLGNLSTLESLYLGGNQLACPIPEWIENLQNLRVLSLGGNHLTGVIPPALGNLSNLEFLYLGGNQLTGTIPEWVENLQNLKRLYLDSNQLTGSIPVTLENLSNLEYLDLEDNQLTGSIPVTLGNLSNLEFLNLEDNQLTGSIPLTLENLSNLEYLDLEDNQLTGSIPPALGNLSNLIVLNLSGNQLTGNIPATLGNFPNMRYLDLGDNQLTGDIPAELGNLSNLRELSVKANNLTGSIPSSFGNLSSLEELWLSDNQLSGNIPAELGNLSNLTHLGLNNNQLAGNIPASLGNLSNLSILWLSYNQLNGDIPPELQNLSNLYEFSMRNNQLTGFIPTWLGELKNLKVIDLHENQMTGSIPENLGSLPLLEKLWLGVNQLNGTIPEELGNLTNLHFLWLNNNQLSGQIPAELKNLINLEDNQLNLQWNQLYTSDPVLRDFLNSKQVGGDWESTQGLNANFAASGTSGSAPLTVKFTDQSSGNPTSWQWDFDNDGTIDSTEQNPSFTYSTAGTYSVRLVAATADASDEEIKINYIDVTETIVLKGDFIASPIYPTETDTVQFTDKSTGNPTSWQWDFNMDGITDSTEQNPSFTYNSTGIYSVKLIVTNADSTDEEIKTNYIKVRSSDPDLQVTDIQCSQAIAGQTIEVSWTITNTGDGPTNAPAWYDRVWISPNIEVRVFEPEDILMGKFTNVSYLAPGESYIQTQEITLPDDMKGVHYLFVITDNVDAFLIDFEKMEASSHGNGAVSETNNRNNFAYEEIEVTPPPPSDLSVTKLITPNNVFSGEGIHVSWTVENTGENNTNGSSWWDAVYFSQDATLNTENAKFLGKQKHAGPNGVGAVLPPGVSYEMTTDVNIPQAVYGDGYIYIVNDMFDDVFEHFGENNNVYRNEAPITITLTPPPDFVVTDLTVPDSGDSGKSVNIIWTVENQGPGKPFERVWSDQVYLSAESEFNPDTAIALESFRVSDSLPPGMTYAKNVEVTIPNGLEGSFYVFVKADGNEQVFEHLYEDNNITGSEYPIQITLSPWADLHVAEILIPDSVTAGENLDIPFTLENNGEASASELWEDHVYISPNAEWTEEDKLLKRVSHTTPLASGISYTYTANVTIPTDFNGTYYIHVLTDAEDKVYEHTYENNNITSLAVTVLPYPPVDLVAEAFTVPGSGSSGQSVDVSYTVKNIGKGTTLSSEWRDAVYFSLDTILDDEDILLERFIHNGAVAYQETYSPLVSVDLPNGVSGDYYLIVKADDRYNVPEDDDTNNTFYSPVTVELTPPPDLEIISSEIPSQGVAGQPLTVSWTVQNNGVAPIARTEWYDGIFLSSDEILNYGDTRLSSVPGNLALGLAETYSVSYETELPLFASGVWYVLIQTDSRDDIYEHEAEDNNVVSQPVLITVPPPSDLIVTDITVPANAVPGEMVTISWTVRNIGPNVAQGRMSEAVYVSEDNVWEFTDPLLGVVSRDIDLAPGSSLRMSMRADIRKAFRADEKGNITETLPGVVGTHFVAVRTDVRNNINESDDVNNTKVSDSVMDVGIPALTANVPMETTLTGMQKRYYRIDADAGLDLRIRFTGDVAETSNEVYVAFDRVPLLTDHDYAGTVPFVANQEVLIPSTQAGTYYILIMARELPGTENVTILAEPMSFSISSITPNIVGQGKVTCRLNGAGFRESVELGLKNDSGIIITKGKIRELVSTMQLKVCWQLDNLPLGSYDIVAIKADGTTADLTNGLTIESTNIEELKCSTIGPDMLRTGGRSSYSLFFTNNGNVDIEYSNVLIFTFSPVNILSISKDSENIYTLTDKRFRKEDIGNQLFFEGYDESNTYLYRIVPLLIKDIAPNDTYRCDVLFDNFINPSFSLGVKIASMKKNEFISYQTDAIESIRLDVLNNSSQYDQILVKNAYDTFAFRDFIFQTQIYAGIIDQQDINVLYGTDTVIPAQVEMIRHLDTQETERVSSLPIEDYPNILNQRRLKRIDYNALACKFGYYSCEFTMVLKCGLIGGLIGGAAGCAGSACAASAATATLGAIVSAYLCEKIYVPYTCGMIDCQDVFNSFDPNEIIGPSGYSHEKWVSKNEMLPYTILFENDPELATVPAQVVSIRQILDSDLDARTFRLSTFGFGDNVFNVPENTAFYSDRLDLTESLGIYVDISAGIDITTNEAFWVFRSIDPETGQAPTNPFAGFLPVNDPETHIGEGFVSYTIKPKKDAVTGDVIDAQARIIFDVNDPIDTPAIFNTIDADTPSSQMQTTAEFIDDTNFSLTWTAQDVADGSGLESVTLYMAADDQPYQIYEADISDTSLTISAAPGHIYKFFTMAKDNAGNTETMKISAEVTVNLVFELPIANAGADQTADEADTVTLDASLSSHPDGEIVSYQWTQTAGHTVTLSDPTAVAPSFTAPDVDSNEVYLTFELIVTDAKNQQDTDSCVVHIRDVVFEDTDQDGMADNWEMEYFGTLDNEGTGDSDEDGISDLDEYLNGTEPVSETVPDDTDNDGMADEWEMTHFGTLNRDGTGDADGDGISDLNEYGNSTHPANPGTDTDSDGLPDDWETNYFGTLEQNGTDDADGDGVSDLDEYLNGTDPTVSDLEPPTADAGPDQEVSENQTVTLNGSNSSDPDNDIAAYQWTQTTGTPVTLSDSASPEPTFIAPDVSAEGVSLTFQLTVTDSSGLQSQDICIVNITWQNEPPTAHAGADQTIDEGETVTLNGSWSYDSDDGIAAYQWSQTQGPSVTLSDPAAIAPSLTAPDVDSNETALIFQLTVTDDGGLQNTDICVIYLRDIIFDDADQDGMADNWETEYFGTLNRNGATDSDGDGISDLDEYLNGTDPLVRTPGDINQDRQIDLKDAILALRIISGIDPDTVVRKAADVNGDDRIGTEEAVYALQIAGGMEIPTNEVSGNISEDTIWSGDIRVSGEITVDDDITLTVSPGTYVEFHGHYKLNIRGTLIAKGTPENRITFTAKNPAEGWHGIRFDNNDRTMDDNDPSEIVYCNLQYGNATDSNDETDVHDDRGGAVFIRNFSGLLISNCIISNNRAAYTGGGICCFYSAPVLTNNVIANNSASKYGGGMYCFYSDPTLTNNTVVSNSALIGGGICCHDNSSPKLVNTILWKNTAEQEGSQAALLQNTCDPYFYYCSMQGGLPAGSGSGYDTSRYRNNIISDPLFVAPSVSPGTDSDGLSADWTLQAASPCINAGDPATTADIAGLTDMAGNPRISGDAVDIGAYEYQE